MDPNQNGRPFTPEEVAAMEKLAEIEAMKNLEAAEEEKTSEPSGETVSENAEPSSPSTGTPSPPNESDNTASGKDSPPTQDETEEGVNDNEVGVVDEPEFVGYGDIPEVRDVSVTCHKCGRKTNTSVTYEQYKELAKEGEQPKFRTKCGMCNYVSTYVLTEEGTDTIA